MKILIVEDSKLIVFQAKSIIEENHIKCDILTCRSAVEGLKILEQHDIDIIILDIVMPKMTGLEMLEVIRKNKKYNDIIVIMFTSLTDKEYLKKSFELGANDFINKPIDEIEFVSRLKAAVKLKSNQIALREAFEVLKEKNEKLKNTTVKLKQMQFHLVQREKLSAIGELAAGVAHEINNPLGYISSNHETLTKFIKAIKEIIREYHDLIDEVYGNNAYEELLNKINKVKEKEELLNINFILEDIDELMSDSKEGMGRVSEIVKSLRNFARTDSEEQKSHCNINDVIEETLLVIKNEWKYSIKIEKEFNELSMMFCNRGQIGQVILNIVVNSIQSIKKSNEDEMGTIIIRTYEKNGYVQIEIEDDGGGIEKTLFNKIFNPFFTTKEVGKGTGLGLSISHDIIVNKHKGEINVESEINKGTTFTIKLPLK